MAEDLIDQLRRRGGVRVTVNGQLHEVRAVMMRGAVEEEPGVSLDNLGVLLASDEARVSSGNGLTEIELQAMDLSADLVNLLAKIVDQHEPDTPQVRRTGVADADINELVLPIHMIQHTIMGQAAARAHPEHCRLLGHTLLEKRGT